MDYSGLRRDGSTPREQQVDLRQGGESSLAIRQLEAELFDAAARNRTLEARMRDLTSKNSKLEENMSVFFR